MQALPSLHSLNLRTAPTGAPGENPPNKRDIIELELLLKRLYELQERADPVGGAEEGEVILSDLQQLNRMLSSLNALYRDGTPRDYQRFGGMTADDVDALADILFELGRASDSKFPKCRSFFLTTGAWKRMYEVLYQLAPGPRGDAARAAARATAEEQRQRRHEAAQREMERMVRYVPPEERPTADLRWPTNRPYLHPGVKKGWDNLANAFVRRFADEYNRLDRRDVFLAARKVVDDAVATYTRDHALPSMEFASSLANELRFIVPSLSLTLKKHREGTELPEEIEALATDEIMKAVRTTTDFKAAVQVRDATVVEYGEFVTPVRDRELFEWVARYPGLREVARRMAAVASDVFLRSAWEAAWWAADGEQGREPPMVEADARRLVQEQLRMELREAKESLEGARAR